MPSLLRWLASEQPADAEKRGYDAFISYSRRDAAFCEILERRLRSYRPPAGLGLPMRRLSVFRDANDLVGADYFTAIGAFLNRSDKLIVVCSPSARASSYVDDEIRRFVEARGADRIVPIILAGLPNNEAAPEREAEKAFPDTLCSLLQMPLAIDFRGFDADKHKIDRGAYAGAWHSLLASLLGRSREEIEERERKRRARQLRFTVAVTSAVGASLVGLSIWALVERDDALKQRDRALAGRLAAEANLHLTDDRADGRLSVLLAGHALQLGHSAQAYKAIVTASRRLPPELVTTLPPVLPDTTGLVERMVVGVDGVHAAMVARYDRRAEIWNLRTGRKVAEIESGDDDGPIDGIRFGRDGRQVAVLRAANIETRTFRTDEQGKGTMLIGRRDDWTRKVEIFDFATGKALFLLQSREFAIAERDGRWLLATADGNGHDVTVKDPVSGAALFSAHVEQPVQHLAWSADGVHLAAAGAQQAWLFDVTRKQVTRTLRLGGAVSQLSIANDGERLLTIDEGGVAKLWSMKTGAAMVLERGKAKAAAFSPLGRYATLLAADGVKVLDTGNGHVALSEGHPGNASAELMAVQGVSGRNPVVGLAMVDGETAWVVGRAQGQIELWQQGMLPSFGKFGVVPGMANVLNLNHGTTMNQMSHSDDGAIVATVGSGSGMSPAGTMIVEPNVVRVWDLRHRREIARIASWDQILAVVTPDGRHLLTGEHAGDIARVSEPSRIKVWKLPENVEATTTGEWKMPMPASISIDGRIAAFRNSAGGVDVGAAGALRHIPAAPPAIRRTALPHSEASEQAALVRPQSDDKDTEAPEPPPQCDVVADFYSLVLSEDGRWVAQADRQTVRLHAVDGSRDATTHAFGATVCSVALSGNGRFLAATTAVKYMAQAPAKSALPQNSTGTFVMHVREAGGHDVAFAATDSQSVVLAVSPNGRFVLTQRLMTLDELAKDPNPLRKVTGNMLKPIVDGWDSTRPNEPAFTLPVAGTPTTGLAMPALASFSKDGRFFALESGSVGTVHVVSDGTEVAEVDLSVTSKGPNTLPQRAIARIGFDADETRLRTAEVDLSGETWKTLARSLQWQPRVLTDSACRRLQAENRDLTSAERRSFFADRTIDRVCGH